MIKKRAGVFETNSSSTHTICINSGSICSKLYFGFDEYGWERGYVYDTASYLNTALYEVYYDNSKEINDYITYIKQVLDDNEIAYEFAQEMDPDIDRGYIDHGCELSELLEDLKNDESLLLQFLSSESYVITGNDNGYEDDEDEEEPIADKIYFKGN